MKNIVISIFLLFFVFNAEAQFPTTGGNRAGGRFGGQSMNVGHFYGKMVDTKTSKGIAGVTIQLKGNKFDTAKKQIKEAILRTVITESNGDFSLDSLPVFGNFKFKATSIGFKAIEKQLSFGIKMPQQGQGGGMPDMQQMLGMVDKDLGNLKMESDATELAAVTVTSSKPQFELGIDRKIFNVDKNIVSAGQTATEIMRNIPSVNVDIDGNVTVRNAAPTIFVDGRPTTLTLDQIPADIVDKVELITNPSAKFDASGGNAGIINVVLKKNKKTGYNGGLRAGVDTRGKVNGGADFSIRQQKVNLFLMGNYFSRKSITNAYSERHDYYKTDSFFNNTSNSTNMGSFGFVRAGADFFIDNRNTISVTGNYNRGSNTTDQLQTIDSFKQATFSNYTLVKTNSEMNFKNFGTQLSYKHNFENNGHNLSADMNYNSSSNTGLSDINNYYSSHAPFLQQSVTSGNTKFLTFQTDYENPFGDDKKLELGGRGAIREFTNNNNQNYYNPISGLYENIPIVSSNYRYKDEVYAVYGTYSFKLSKTSFQLGLRAESSKYTGTIASTTSNTFSVDYPVSLFPSVFVTHKLTDAQDMQLNYSRRVNRPNFFQLIPFPDYSDPTNISVGNPGLKPEFTHSFEVNYNNAYKKGANFLVTGFFKYSENLITRYTYKDVNKISPKQDSAYFSTYVNANSSMSYGIELTNKIAVTKWWDMTLNLNIYNSQINANIPGQSITNGLWSWFGKFNNSFKIAKGWTLQFSGDYQAKTVLAQSGGGGGGRFGGMGGGGGMMFGGGNLATAQGYILPKLDIDLGLRKEWTWKKGRTGSLSINMNDIFRSNYNKTYSEQAGLFTQNTERLRDPQIVRVNFSYRFGRFDVNLFKRKNTKADQTGGMEMMGGGN